MRVQTARALMLAALCTASMAPRLGRAGGSGPIQAGLGSSACLFSHRRSGRADDSVCHDRCAPLRSVGNCSGATMAARSVSDLGLPHDLPPSASGTLAIHPVTPPLSTPRAPDGCIGVWTEARRGGFFPSPHPPS